MQIGIIGLKYSGKTTLFNAITRAGVPTGQGGVESNRAVGAVPDSRLDWLTELHAPTRQVNAQIEWVDVPGFKPGMTEDGGREATRFLEHARRMDSLAQVVRCFDEGYGHPDPEGEIEALALELILADLQIVENRLERLAKEKQKLGKVANPLEPPLMERFRVQLENGNPLREVVLNRDDRKLVSGFSFLTIKPMIYVLNLDQEMTAPAAVVQKVQASGGQVISVCAKLEEELAELPAAEAAEFLADLGIEEPALHRMIRAAYDALSLISFFTVGSDECRAWTVHRNSHAPQAAAVIHSDLERGFIRAVVVPYHDLHTAGTMAAAKLANKVREEGKGYVVQDGDVIEIRFCV